MLDGTFGFRIRGDAGGHTGYRRDGLAVRRFVFYYF